MEGTKKQSGFWLIGGIFSILAALYALFCFYQSRHGGIYAALIPANMNFSVLAGVVVFFYLILGVFLFSRTQSPVVITPFVLSSICNLADLILVMIPAAKIVHLLSLVLNVCCILIILSLYTEKLPGLRPYAKQFWYAPIAYLIVSNCWMLIYYDFSSLFSITMVVNLLSMLPYAFALIWHAYPDEDSLFENDAPDIARRDIPNAFCSVGTHVLLLLFTFGVWLLIWIYRTTAFLNCDTEEEPRDPTKKLLLCMFIPFYHIYWTYKSAQRIDRLAKKSGVDSDISTLCLVMAIFLPIVAHILMQDKINSIVTAPLARRTAPAPAATPIAAETVVSSEVIANAAASPNRSGADELRKYKDLLDDGIITQEEFDAKKKQLLGL